MTMATILSRGLAAGRCFRRAMCAAAAAATAGSSQHHRAPPPTEALPQSVRGIFSNYCDLGPLETQSWDTVLDHCNGLLLYHPSNIDDSLCVCNPTTRRWALLPPHGGDVDIDGCAGAYLAFDPAVSPHYEVVLIPEVPDEDVGDDSMTTMEMEWPPAACKLQVFSSSTGRWSERAFAGRPFCTVAEARSYPVEPVFWGPDRRYAEYWKGALYVHCRGAYVTRLSLSDDKYEVIETPTDIEKDEVNGAIPYLGRSKNGVCYAVLQGHELWVWILDERAEQMDWVLAHYANLEKLRQRPMWCHLYDEIDNAPWAIFDRWADCGEEQKVDVEEVNEWDSDNDGVIDFEKFNWQSVGGSDPCSLKFLGTHPFKEVVFFSYCFHVISYHLGSSKVQYLGYARPKDYMNHCASFEQSFLYTPCSIDFLPGNHL
ncbi:hypothetical protein ACP4OV_011768 [Aristida adscensionis]